MASERISVSRAAHGLQGCIDVPGDKSISHRVAILGALARGSMRVKNYLCSEDCLNTLRAMQQLGATVTPGDTPQDFTLTGCAMQPAAPQRDIDCGNSGTGMRLMAGVLAALPFESRLYGDRSLSKRPMKRILDPLTLMGARVEACGEKPGCAPLHICGGTLQPIDYTLPMASAQVKSAVLLAGMLTRGTTRVHQPAVTRDHTERLFAHFGIPCSVSEDGLDIAVTGPVDIAARDITIPGDISSAAFWLVAACIVPGSELTLRNVGLNPTRCGIIPVLQRMGADITIGNRVDAGEPYGDITVRHAPHLHGTDIGGAEIPNIIDEIPVLAVAAAFAEGTTTIRDAAELRVKESDRIATTAGNLRAMGAAVEELDDGMRITGGAPLHGATLQSFDDHRISMSFLMAGLAAEGVTTLEGCRNIGTSYPGFEETLRHVAARY
ncbi:MAG: 3-phosphoshikimate 1-carboxyvinyltransferase [Akkermansia sp.]|nr:3-phosphoshikimate 1-carboxyvinyltransferase [Akkermansia sp.]